MGANVGTQGIHHKTTPSTPIKEADKVNAKAAASGNPTINSNNSVQPRLHATTADAPAMLRVAT